MMQRCAEASTQPQRRRFGTGWWRLFRGQAKMREWLAYVELFPPGAKLHFDVQNPVRCQMAPEDLEQIHRICRMSERVNRQGHRKTLL